MVLREAGEAGQAYVLLKSWAQDSDSAWVQIPAPVLNGWVTGNSSFPGPGFPIYPMGR